MQFKPLLHDHGRGPPPPFKYEDVGPARSIYKAYSLKNFTTDSSTLVRPTTKASVRRVQGYRGDTYPPHERKVNEVL